MDIGNFEGRGELRGEWETGMGVGNYEGRGEL